MTQPGIEPQSPGPLANTKEYPHVYLPDPTAKVKMNSEYSFSKFSCLTKAKEPNLYYHFAHS